MSETTPIDYLGRGLHQDCLIEITSLDELAKNVLDFLNDSEKTELQGCLAASLASLTSSELKGMLNRASHEIRFDSAGARKFLEAVNGQLSPASHG